MRISPILLCLGLAVAGPGAAHAGPTTAAPPGMANGYYAQLGAQALTQVGLESIEGYVDQLLDDPSAAYGFSYVVGCALPFQTKLVLEKDGKRVEFEGSLGLAPQWAEGACDLDCQEWVSACMLARTNAYGLPVYIYTDGPHPHLEEITREGRDGATVREGAFFGNLFQSPQEQYACRGDDRDPLALTWRVCTRPGNRCGIQALGACGDVDGETGAAVEDPVCDVNEKGLYTRCRSGHGPNAKVWERVITNFMRPTSFGGPRAESCGEPAPAAPPEQTPGDAGAPCLTNDGCGEDLICDTGWLGTGLCTRACDEEMDAEAPCGAGNTCLSIGSDPRCTRACEHGTCAAGQVCTTLWLNLPTPDDPGCLPFCHTDADCGEGTKCDPRFGSCGAGAAPDDFLEDGEPCLTSPDPATAGEGPVYCKGSCFQVDDDPTRGLCASLVDLSAHDDCPDRPETMTPFQTTARDDLALCIYRNCRSNDECSAPLTCQRAGVAGGHCVY